MATKDWMMLTISIVALLISALSFLASRRRDKEERHLESVKKTSEAIHASQMTELALMAAYERCRLLELAIDLKVAGPEKREIKEGFNHIGKSILGNLDATRKVLSNARASQRLWKANYDGRVPPVPHELRVNMDDILSRSNAVRELAEKTISDLDLLYNFIQKEVKEIPKK